MVIMIAANIINIFANYFLVYGVYGFPELGAEGSIWATFIVRCMQVVAILSYVWFFIDHEKFGLGKPKITWRGGTDLRRIGYARAFQWGWKTARLTRWYCLPVFSVRRRWRRMSL